MKPHETAMVLITAAVNDDLETVLRTIATAPDMGNVTLTLIGWLDAHLGMAAERLGVDTSVLLQELALDYAREGSG